jgi:hypothetical protein
MAVEQLAGGLVVGGGKLLLGGLQAGGELVGGRTGRARGASARIAGGRDRAGGGRRVWPLAEPLTQAPDRVVVLRRLLDAGTSARLVVPPLQLAEPLIHLVAPDRRWDGRRRLTLGPAVARVGWPLALGAGVLGEPDGRAVGRIEPGRRVWRTLPPS